ncbi:MAG: CBS domain-containing protein [Planctomycetota bacterium]
MRRRSTRCMPVVDTNGSVQGLVTVFDVFKALLACG